MLRRVVVVKVVGERLVTIVVMIPRRVVPLMATAVLSAVAFSGCGSNSGEPPADATDRPTTPSNGAGSPGSLDESMNMEMGPDAPVAMQSLGAQNWQGMRVELATMGPSSFTLFQGTDTEAVTPSDEQNLHIMAVLSDEKSGERIPYASCWITVRNESGKIVADERLWPMLSRDMGTHYGINVALPEAGTYNVELRVDPPQAARHPEYTDVWTHSETFDFEVDFDG